MRAPHDVSPVPLPKGIITQFTSPRWLSHYGSFRYSVACFHRNDLARSIVVILSVLFFRGADFHTLLLTLGHLSVSNPGNEKHHSLLPVSEFLVRSTPSRLSACLWCGGGILRCCGAGGGKDLAF